MQQPIFCPRTIANTIPKKGLSLFSIGFNFLWCLSLSLSLSVSVSLSLSFPISTKLNGILYKLSPKHTLSLVLTSTQALYLALTQTLSLSPLSHIPSPHSRTLTRIPTHPNTPSHTHTQIHKRTRIDACMLMLCYPSSVREKSKLSDENFFGLRRFKNILTGDEHDRRPSIFDSIEKQRQPLKLKSAPASATAAASAKDSAGSRRPLRIFSSSD